MHQNSMENPVAEAFDRRAYAGLMQRGAFQEVMIALQPQLARDASDPGMLDLVADCYFGLDRADRGIEVLEAIVATWPDNLAAWGKLGARSLQNGQKERAAEAFKVILKHNPNSAQALSTLYLAAPYSWDSAHGKRLRRLASSAKLSKAEKVSASNTLGKLASAFDKPAIAFRYYQAAKDATLGIYDSSATSASVTAQCHSFAPERLPQVATTGNTSRPLFIVGLPRSGTTLLETMLRAHPDVASIGESPALIQTRQAIQNHLRQHDPAAPDWAWCDQTSPELAQAGREAYLAQLSQPGTAPGTVPCRVTIDKLPQNLFEMGFARMILPEARFVFMMRHPLDIGLSLFTTNFHQGHHYSKDLRLIGQHIRANYASLDDYIPKLGDRLRLQSYRQLVETPEPQMRAILAHLDLGWEAACLAPQDSRETVTTASLLQVREGVNRSGLNKWPRFETQLQPLIDALGGWDWIKEWEARDAALD
jgi:tetratricopeptide (TPR) repeat protein